MLGAAGDAARPPGRGDPETLQAQGSFACIPALLQTKQRHWVQSRRACIASGCGASGETSSRREKRTEGLKTIPVSRVTLCHAKQPWGKPHRGRLRGRCAGPAGPPVLTPCSPSGAGRGARRLPKGWCPPALLTIEDGVCGVEAVVVQEQPLLSPPLTKNKPHGVSAPHPVNRGQRMGGNTQAQLTLPGGVAQGTLRKGPPL